MKRSRDNLLVFKFAAMHRSLQQRLDEVSKDMKFQGQALAEAVKEEEEV